MRQTILLLFVIAIAAPAFAHAQSRPLPVINIGIAIDGSWERTDEIVTLFQREILALAEGEFDVRFAADKTIVAEWTAAGARDAVDRLLADRDVDMVVALGVIASHVVCQRRDLPKPVIAPFIIDADLQGLPRQGGASGVKNLNYIAFPHNLSRDLKAFHEVAPFKRLAMMTNQNLREAIPDLGARAERILRSLDIDGTVISVGQSIDEALAQLPQDIDAVYVAPLHHLPPGEFDRLIAQLIERRIPSFSLMGRTEVERGIFCGINSGIFSRIARRVALNAQQILLGKDAGSLQTAFEIGGRLTINMATARAIGLYPSWGVLTEAELINETRQEITRTVSLESAAREAVAANLELAARNKSVESAEEDIRLARANLLPQFDLSLLGVQIDKDRAESSMGQQAERTLSGSVTLNQLLFSEPAWANLSIQKHLQKSRELERDVLALDIAQSAATAYLNLLRAKTFERIQKDNLGRTRSNLEMARIREAIGAAGAAEVLRWESELANNRKDVIDANSRRNLGEIALNRLLHRPAEESYATEEADLDDPSLLLSQGRFFDYMDNPWDFKLLRTFMVEEGLRATPEIRALHEALAAQERSAQSAARSFWMPDLGLQAELANVFSRGGAGSKLDTSGLPTSFSGLLQEPEDLSWQVAVSLSYPLFSGGAKFAERSKATKALAQLRLELESLSEIVEQRIRSAMHAMGASYAGIEQARAAANAADRTLEMVKDAYSRGATDILDLLDAQNNALVADEVAANAIYDFLIDFMEAERSIGRLVLQMSQQDREAFFDRLDRYFAEAGRQMNR